MIPGKRFHTDSEWVTTQASAVFDDAVNIGHLLATSEIELKQVSWQLPTGRTTNLDTVASVVLVFFWASRRNDENTL